MAPYITMAVSVLISIATIIITISRDHGAKFQELQGRVIALETKIAVFWERVTIEMGGFLHKPHPDHKRMDDLIDKLIAELSVDSGAIEVDELRELIRRLEMLKTSNEAHPVDQLAASFMLMAMEQQRERDLFARALEPRRWQ